MKCRRSVKFFFCSDKSISQSVPTYLTNDAVKDICNGFTQTRWTMLTHMYTIGYWRKTKSHGQTVRQNVALCRTPSAGKEWNTKNVSNPPVVWTNYVIDIITWRLPSQTNAVRMRAPSVRMSNIAQSDRDTQHNSFFFFAHTMQWAVQDWTHTIKTRCFIWDTFKEIWYGRDPVVI